MRISQSQEKAKGMEHEIQARNDSRARSGRLTLDVLLPSVENASLGPIGGPGREFWVFGTNHTNDVGEDNCPYPPAW